MAPSYPEPRLELPFKRLLKTDAHAQGCSPRDQGEQAAQRRITPPCSALQLMTEQRVRKRTKASLCPLNLVLPYLARALG